MKHWFPDSAVTYEGRRMKTTCLSKTAISSLLVSAMALSGCDARVWPTNISEHCEVEQGYVDGIAEIAKYSDVHNEGCTGETYEANKQVVDGVHLFFLAVLLAVAANNDSDSTSSSGGGGNEPEYTPF